MRRSITIFAGALTALALAGPATATVTPDADKDLATWSSIPQWVAPFPVANDDRTFTLAPNTTQTFVTPIPEAQPGTWHVLAPCWGYDIVGPGVDLAAGGVNPYGYLGTPNAEMLSHSPTARQAPDGSWFLPDSDAMTITPWMLKDGELCRKIGWSFYVTDPAQAGGTFAAAARKAKRTHRNVRVKPRKPTGRNARKANVAAGSGVTVELAGLHLLTDHRIELVVRVTTGALAGPTTLYTHARVLLQHS
jgi:hypothetical protein